MDGQTSMTRKLRKSEVAQRYGNINPRTVDRWTADERLGFPQPMYVGSTPLWDEDQLNQWDRDRANPGRPASPMTADS
jgi:hypothetical protein